MSIFGDLDLENAADDPFAVKPGTYIVVVDEAGVQATKDGSKNGLTLSYKIVESDDDSTMIGRRISEWKDIPKFVDPKNPTEEEARQASFLKQRLLSLGIPSNELNSTNPSDLAGTGDRFMVTVVQTEGKGANLGKTYTNVRTVRLYTDNSAPQGNPFKTAKK